MPPSVHVQRKQKDAARTTAADSSLVATTPGQSTCWPCTSSAPNECAGAARALGRRVARSAPSGGLQGAPQGRHRAAVVLAAERGEGGGRLHLCWLRRDTLPLGREV
eukprot:1655618-Prymnesium_polylepis.1